VQSTKSRILITILDTNCYQKKKKEEEEEEEEEERDRERKKGKAKGQNAIGFFNNGHNWSTHNLCRTGIEPSIPRRRIGVLRRPRIKYFYTTQNMSCYMCL